MLRRVHPVRTDVPEEGSASIIRVTRIGELFLLSVRRLLVTAKVVASSSILVTLMTENIHPSVTSILTRATRRNLSEDGIVRSHRRENLKSYSAALSTINLICICLGSKPDQCGGKSATKCMSYGTAGNTTCNHCGGIVAHYEC
jgi:hypothetical protein